MRGAAASAPRRTAGLRAFVRFARRGGEGEKLAVFEWRKAGAVEATAMRRARSTLYALSERDTPRPEDGGVAAGGLAPAARERKVGVDVRRDPMIVA